MKVFLVGEIGLPADALAFRDDVHDQLREEGLEVVGPWCLPARRSPLDVPGAADARCRSRSICTSSR
jgi:hypothetical protein